MKFFVFSAAISEYLLTVRNLSVPFCFSGVHRVRLGAVAREPQTQTLVCGPIGECSPTTVRNKVPSRPAPVSPSKRRF